MKRAVLWGISLALSTSLAQMPVAATTGFIGDMVRNIGGSRITLTVMAPPNVDPHSFEPKPSVLIGVSKARVIFANGLGLEPFLGPIRAQAPADVEVVLLGEGQTGLIKNGSSYDPHLWLDPTYGIRYAQSIREALSKLDPAGRAIYQANAARYIAEIQQADKQVLACLRTVPVSARKIVSQHEALLYFSRHYQISEVGSIADFAGQEKGPRRFAKLAELMKQQGIKTVFAEPQFPKNEARALAEATGARVSLIYSDAFASPVNTYLELLRANGQAVCEAFR